MLKTTKTILFSACVGAATLAWISPWAFSQAPTGAAGASGRAGGLRGNSVAFDYSDNAGWQSLFDGRSLTGWEGAPGMWDINDGAIHIDTACEHPTGTTYIYYTGGEFSDFMLKFDMKGTLGVNGGMQFRSFLTADPNAPKYPARQPAAGAAAGRGGSGGRGPAVGAAAGSGRGGGGGGRGPQVTCATPPPAAPSRASLAKWDMNGYQLDFDANNTWPGNIYEQGARGVMTTPGHAILAEPGQPIKVVATLADKPTLDSWFHKDDYNHFLVIAKGNTIQTYMNDHLVFVMLDNDPNYFRASGKIGPEVEATGGYWVKNIFLKKL